MRPSDPKCGAAAARTECSHHRPAVFSIDSVAVLKTGLPGVPSRADTAANGGTAANRPRALPGTISKASKGVSKYRATASASSTGSHTYRTPRHAQRTANTRPTCAASGTVALAKTPTGRRTARPSPRSVNPSRAHRPRGARQAGGGKSWRCRTSRLGFTGRGAAIGSRHSPQ